MKTVFPTSEIFHLWANRTHSHRIRNSQGNVSAEGVLLFSYRECIGILTDTGAIISSKNWSNTTSGHQWEALRAVSGGVLRLPCNFPSTGSLAVLADNARHEGRNILKRINSDNKARLMNKAIQSALASYYTLTDFAHSVDKKGEAIRVNTLPEVRALREGLLNEDNQAKCRRHAHNIKSTLADVANRLLSEKVQSLENEKQWLETLPETLDKLTTMFLDCGEPFPKSYNNFAKTGKKLLKEVDKKQKIYIEKRAIENAEKIALWRTGEYVNLPHGLPPMLRIEKLEIVTSWGARVPVAVCPILWTMVQDAIATKTDREHSIEVGNYTLEKVFADGSIKVGCHTIAYSEIELIAKELKYI